MFVRVPIDEWKLFGLSPERYSKLLEAPAGGQLIELLVQEIASTNRVELR